MAKERIETKKDEIRYITSDPAKMFNMWIPNRVLRKYNEDFLDEDSGEVVTIERSEILFERGTLIDQDVLQSIQFWMQEGSIKEIEVSNQKRLAFERQSTALSPWTVKVEIQDKKYKLLVYASSIGNVLEIMNDYIELNYSNGYTIVMVKEMDSCIILTDNYSKQKVDLEKAYLKDEISLEEYTNAKNNENDAEEVAERKFYQLEVKITYSDETEVTQNFIVHTFDTDRALMCISQYLKKWEQKKVEEHREKGWSEWEVREFKLCIEKAAPMPVGALVPKEFSLAYNVQG